MSMQLKCNKNHLTHALPLQCHLKGSLTDVHFIIYNANIIVFFMVK